MAAPDCYLGIDLGTSGVRGIAIDTAGRVCAEARATLPGSTRPVEGHSEQVPADWWRATCGVVAGVARQVPGRVRALSVDGTSSTVLLCDTDGVPVSPALMYDDRRALREAARVRAVAPADSAAHGPGSTLSKVLHLLAAGHPAAAVIAHQADWIVGRLGGVFGISDENNALKLGYDAAARCWPAWLDELPLDRGLLPRVVPVGTPLGTVAPDQARALGLPQGVEIVAGTTDSNAATLAAGVEGPGDAVTSLGSTLVLKILSEVRVASPAHGIYSHRIGDRWLVGGASNSGGAVLRRYFDDERLVALSGRIDPGTASGLDYYPLPVPGERFPVSDPQLQPRLTPRPADDAAFLHGILEGIARIEADGYRLLASLGAPPPRRVLTAGGGATNPTWTRIRQRLLGVPVQPAAHREAAYGAALVARGAFGPD